LLGAGDCFSVSSECRWALIEYSRAFLLSSWAVRWSPLPCAAAAAAWACSARLWSSAVRPCGLWGIDFSCAVRCVQTSSGSVDKFSPATAQRNRTSGRGFRAANGSRETVADWLARRLADWPACRPLRPQVQLHPRRREAESLRRRVVFQIERPALAPVDQHGQQNPVSIPPS